MHCKQFQGSSTDGNLDGLDRRLVELAEESPDPPLLEQLPPWPQRCGGGSIAADAVTGGGQCSTSRREQEEQGNKVEAASHASTDCPLVYLSRHTHTLATIDTSSCCLLSPRPLK